MNLVLSSLKFIFIDIVGDFLYWPIWWYTVGLGERLKSACDQIKKTWQFLGLGIWIRNTFVPMYGDKSIIGRLISFFMRIVILVWRLVWFLIWSILIIAIVLLWILAPILIIWMILEHFNLKK